MMESRVAGAESSTPRSDRHGAGASKTPPLPPLGALAARSVKVVLPQALMLDDRRQDEPGQDGEDRVPPPERDGRVDDVVLADVHGQERERVVQDDDRHEARDERTQEVAFGEEDADRGA